MGSARPRDWGSGDGGLDLGRAQRAVGKEEGKACVCGTWMLLQSSGMQEDRLGEQGLSELRTSGCSQLGLCSRGVGRQPLCIPAAA